jgi:hypothetical protein
VSKIKGGRGKEKRKNRARRTVVDVCIWDENEAEDNRAIRF